MVASDHPSRSATETIRSQPRTPASREAGGAYVPKRARGPCRVAGADLEVRAALGSLDAATYRYDDLDRIARRQVGRR
jgi:hypothetical protein